ncbi:uncharacterized protein LOC100897798 isoform X2 [Galendromus occidentalis]|nr:uncharacterized protein LOC100897798 isoform X2 [Galendromus occidentalis]XP_018496805.1 uncharacterized protein LOC100897798 isoform X2 [Galendromus occidentalis]
MGVGKKIRRIFSFGKKRGEKPAIEAANVDKSNTFSGSKPKSTSVLSIRKFSFGSKDKTKKDRAKKGVPPTPEPATTLAAAAPEVTTVPLAAPEIDDTVLSVEANGPDQLTQQAEKVPENLPGEVAGDQSNNIEDPAVGRAEVRDTEGASKDGDAGGVVTEQSDSPPSEQPDVPAEEPREVLSAASAREEPKTITEVINKIHDKTETNQTGNEFVRTVETEQERTLAEDGTTIISRSTKTTTTTVDRGSVGNVSQVKTEIKKEVMPRVSNGHSRHLSQQAVRKPNISLLFVSGLLAVAVVCAILYKLQNSAMHLSV